MRPHSAVWLLPAGLLFFALLPLPYGFYTLLRIVVCAAAGYLAYHEYALKEGFSAWVVALGVIALVLNPFIPVHLSREIWAPIDIGAAIALIAHWKVSARSSEE